MATVTGVGATPSIRWATDEDRAAFSGVVRQTQHALYTSIISHAEIDAAHDGTVPMRKTWEQRRAEAVGLLVAVVDGLVVGGANLVMHHDGEAELTTMYVLPAYEGRGIGSALWNASIEALRARAVPVLQVWTAPAAHWAVAFYARRGCTAFATGEASFGAHAVPHVGYRVALS